MQIKSKAIWKDNVQVAKKKVTFFLFICIFDDEKRKTLRSKKKGAFKRVRVEKSSSKKRGDAVLFFGKGTKRK